MGGCEGAGPARPPTLRLKPIASFHGTPIPASLGPLNRMVRKADVVHVVGFRDPVGTAAAWFANRAGGSPYVVEPAGMRRRRVRSVPLKRVFDDLVGDRVIGRAARVIATSSLEHDELIEDGVDAVRDRPCGRTGSNVGELLGAAEAGRRFRAREQIP